MNVPSERADSGEDDTDHQTLGARPLWTFAVFVPGRPTGYAGGDNEKAWKRTVAEGCRTASPPPDGGFAVELEFVLTDGQRPHEPDLDNLIKSTVDAMESALGRRKVRTAVTQADDVRVQRIVATKRFALHDEQAGVRICVTEV